MASDYSTYADTQLVRLMAEGEEPALRELIDRYWPSLFRRANNFLDDEDAAKDCVQEVFIWLWLHRDGLDIGNMDHYLHQATRFQAFKALREQKAADNFESRLIQFTEKIMASDELEFKELKAFLENLIETLPEDQRLIFRLHREEGLTYKEIAEKLNISVKTVEKKMSLSLRYLRARSGDAFILLYMISVLR
jgi:RNA polymerase sigma-70 factor (ECF subfamily)